MRVLGEAANVCQARQGSRGTCRADELEVAVFLSCPEPSSGIPESGRCQPRLEGGSLYGQWSKGGQEEWS